MLIRATSLFFVLISPAWAAVSVQYVAQDTVIWEIKSGKISLNIQSPTTTYDDHTGQIQLLRPVGIMFDEQSKHHRFQADQGTFWPKERNLDLSQNVLVQTQDGATLRAKVARARQNPLRLELSGGVAMEQPPNSEENLAYLSLKAKRGVVYLDTKKAKFEGACQTQFVEKDNLLILSSTAEIVDPHRQVKFGGGTILKGNQLNANATDMDIFFSSLQQSGSNPPKNKINLDIFQLAGNPQLKFNPKNGDPYRILGQHITIDMLPDQDIKSIEAIEKVKVTLPDGQGLSDKFQYHLPSSLLTFTGHPARLTLEKESFSGQEILYHSKTKVIQVARADIQYQDKDKKDKDESKKSITPP